MDPSRESWLGLLKTRWRPPYVVFVESGTGDAKQKGSGFFVDEWHVVTCLHVLHHPKDNRLRHAIAEPIKSFLDLQSMKTRSVQVCLDDELVGATCIAEDRAYDIALLKLDHRLAGLAPPQRRQPIRSAEPTAYVCGFPLGNGRQFLYHEIPFSGGDILMDGGIETLAGHGFGSQGGFSGGPVFREVDGEPAFIGLARLGGDGSSTGSLIASDFIHDFVRPYIRITGNATAHPRKHRCLLRGYKPEFDVEISGPAISLPALFCLDKEDGGPITFISKSPLSATAADILLDRPGRSSAGKLPAHLTSHRSVKKLIDRLKEDGDLPFRPPSTAEWKHFHSMLAGDTPIRTIGRPASLADFALPDGQSRRGPASALEWLEGEAGLALFKTSSGIPEPVDATVVFQSQTHDRATLRLALTAGGKKR